jgi:hypothetical protein
MQGSKGLGSIDHFLSKNRTELQLDLVLLSAPLLFTYRGLHLQFSYDYDYDYALCNIPDKGLEYHAERNIL